MKEKETARDNISYQITNSDIEDGIEVDENLSQCSQKIINSKMVDDTVDAPVFDNGRVSKIQEEEKDMILESPTSLDLMNQSQQMLMSNHSEVSSKGKNLTLPSKDEGMAALEGLGTNEN